MCCVRANQKPERPVSTRPLSGISVGSTTSYVEMRSVATSSSRSSPSAYSSRTLPLPMCTVSGMHRRLACGHERAQPLEDGVHVGGVRLQREHVVEIDTAGKGRIAPCKLAQVELLVPCAHREPLHEPVGIVAAETALDEGEQEPLAE